jgi:transcriptional regulator with XRE-family HTH domain
MVYEGNTNERCKGVDMSLILGERIRMLRGKQDLSLRELAKKVEKTPAHISDIELGRRHPSEELLRKIANELKASYDDLAELNRQLTVADVKKQVFENAELGLAFRRLIDSEIKPEEIMKWIEKQKKSEK